MTGHDFIKLAGRLALSSDPASLRTAVNRAYHGAFHLSIAFLKDVGCAISTNDHGEPIRMPNQSGNAHAKHAGRLLNDLQSERIQADYRLGNEAVGLPANVRRMVESAHEFRDLLRKCNSQEVRAEIKAAIEAYLAKRERR